MPRSVSRTVCSVLLLSAWCGLVAGLLEAAAIEVRKQFFDANQLYGMSRHFVWLLPATNLCLFLAFGVLGCGTILAFGRRGRWIFDRGLCGLTLLPILLVGLSQIYAFAWLVLVAGVSMRLVPMIERHGPRFGRVVALSFPLVAGVVLVLAAGPFLTDRGLQSQENAQPMPAAGSPNVLLIVMDTVAAGHSSVNGYDQATTTTLLDVAERGIRFDAAQAGAPWTLPSHATMFTAQWMHDLGVGWLTPLGNTHPTLAEFLVKQGYATAGFVANTPYAARDSGLSRGFTIYRDYIFPKLTVFKRTALVNRVLVTATSVLQFLDDQFEVSLAGDFFQTVRTWLDADRKTAAHVNKELLDWLSDRPQPDRPFFAFLNYFDAHYPYQIPAGRFHRFGGLPADSRQVAMIEHWGELDKNPLEPEEVQFAAKAYDDCIADLDEQIGILIDRLRKRGVLENTWVIITADHGESFGEHKGVFCHGTSVYQTEVHVPLVILPPGGKPVKRVVTEAVSLRDLAATIVDVTGQAKGSPFPGRSLARFWDGSGPAAVEGSSTVEPALAEVISNPNAPGIPKDQAIPKPYWPLAALKETDWTYLRREKDKREELFHLKEDAREERNLVSDPAAKGTLERMRAALGRMTGGPLLPERFSP